VVDTGIGISKENKPLIFDAFQQAEGSTSRRYGGTGLGLSISRQLAQLLGGELQLESEEGKGSAFTLYLPESCSDIQKSMSSEAEESASETDERLPVTASTETVSQTVPTQMAETMPAKQVVDDDRENLQPVDKSILIIEDDGPFSRMAREKAFKCIIAEDGQTGLQFAQAYQPNAIILDVGLPQLDDWTIMNRLKDDPQTRAIPVHFMSASDLSRDAKKMGAIGYSLKPISMGELNDAFKKIELFIAKSLKNLLLVVDNEPRHKEILGTVKEGEVRTTVAKTLAQATSYLQTAPFDCIVVDIGVEKGAGIKLLEQLQHKDGLSDIPIILYAARELTTSENQLLQQCENNLTVKTVKSQERLLDETTLFLHQLETNLSQGKREMLQMVHNKEAILAHKNVLIVDDDMRNTFALMTVLEEKDMEVFVAENGKEAIEKLEQQPDMNIILMDIMMPGMDGYETIRQIRKMPLFYKLPIIALTAKAMKGDKTKCIEAGANDYVSKPVDTEKLISLMRVWL